MSHYPDSIYKILQLNDMPPGVFGETYVIAVGINTTGTSFKGEYHVLTQRPTPALNSGRWRFDQASVPADLLTVDLEFMIEESITLARNVLFEMLRRRANELCAEHIAVAPVSLKAPAARPFVGCQMRGLFTEQIVALAKNTECESLYRYLFAVSQILPIQYG